MPFIAPLIALAMLLSGCCGSPTSAPAPTPTPTTAASPPTATTTPSTAGVVPVGGDDRSGCRRLSWLGASGKGYTTHDVEVKLQEDDKLLIVSWEGGSMRLVRAPKDVRAYDGPWTSPARGKGRARINFKEPYTTGTGFWMEDGSPKRRRLTIGPCLAAPDLDQSTEATPQ